jgi:uncharacterized membrane protein
MTDDLFDRLERQLGRLLYAGVMSAAACLTIGLLLSMARVSPAISNTILTSGLIILMLTPLARVVTSLVAYARMRDWFFVVTTVMVFGVLLLAWLLKSRL